MIKTIGHNTYPRNIGAIILIIIVSATAVFITGVLSGCKSLPPPEETQSAMDETRTLINENISDEAKAKKLIALLENLESDLKAFYENQAAHNKALVKRNADYDASRKDIQKLYDAYNKDARLIVEKIAKTHLEMKKLSTLEEWSSISKPKHRIGGAL